MSLEAIVTTLRPLKAAQVQNVVGISKRMLDSWVSSGLVPASLSETCGTGTDHLFAFNDLLVAAVIAGVRSCSLSLDETRAAAGFVGKLSVQYEQSGSSLGYLLVIGAGQVVTARPGRLEKVLTDSELETAMVLNLDKIADDLRGGVTETLIEGVPRRGRKRGTRNTQRRGRRSD